MLPQLWPYLPPLHHLLPTMSRPPNWHEKGIIRLIEGCPEGRPFCGELIGEFFEVITQTKTFTPAPTTVRVFQTILSDYHQPTSASNEDNHPGSHLDDTRTASVTETFTADLTETATTEVETVQTNTETIDITSSLTAARLSTQSISSTLHTPLQPST
jgi:hypothetical protein